MFGVKLGEWQHDKAISMVVSTKNKIPRFARGFCMTAQTKNFKPYELIKVNHGTD